MLYSKSIRLIVSPTLVRQEQVSVHSWAFLQTLESRHGSTFYAGATDRQRRVSHAGSPCLATHTWLRPLAPCLAWLERGVGRLSRPVFPIPDNRCFQNRWDQWR